MYHSRNKSHLQQCYWRNKRWDRKKYSFTFSVFRHVLGKDSSGYIEKCILMCNVLYQGQCFLYLYKHINVFHWAMDSCSFRCFYCITSEPQFHLVKIRKHFFWLSLILITDLMSKYYSDSSHHWALFSALKSWIS